MDINPSFLKVCTLDADLSLNSEVGLYFKDAFSRRVSKHMYTLENLSRLAKSAARYEVLARGMINDSD